MEFLIVDDSSTDETKNLIIEAKLTDSRIKYVCSKLGQNNLRFKKRALDAAIHKSNNEILLFTDVDCIMGKLWVQSMLECFDKDTDYIIGFSRAVFFKGSANLFQRIDFLMLMFSAKSVSTIGWPLACSGQNQAYRKSLFKKVGGYQKIADLLMGDDSIFMQLCLKYGAKVKFNVDPNSYIFCRPEKNWKSLLFQRMRWAGDGNIMWKYNFLFYLVMLSTAISNFFILFLIFSYSFNFFLIVLSIKAIFEITLAFLGSNYFKEKISIWEFAFWFIINIPYICIMSVLSFFTRFLSWKNRSQ